MFASRPFFRLALSAALVGGIVFTGAATAQQDPVQNAIGARKAQMQLYAHNLGIVGAMAQGAVPFDAEIASRAAGNLDALANLDQTSYWIEGSVGIEGTKALPAILEDFADYTAQVQGLRTATAALVTAAGTDQAALQGAMGAMGAACGACHQAYRAR